MHTLVTDVFLFFNRTLYVSDVMFRFPVLYEHGFLSLTGDVGQVEMG